MDYRWSAWVVEVVGEIITGKSAFRVFDTRIQADRFATEKRALNLTCHVWEL